LDATVRKFFQTATLLRSFILLLIVLLGLTARVTLQPLYCTASHASSNCNIAVETFL